MQCALAAIIFVASSASALAQMTPVGVWQSVDAKTNEASSDKKSVAESPCPSP